jgi:AraC-like DNA-binding protein
MSAEWALPLRESLALSRGLQSGPAHSYTADTAFIPWADHGVLLMEFARSRSLDTAAWLSAAGVSAGDALSPRQLLGLLLPLQRSAKDAAFVLGQLSLPGHFGLASQALHQAPNLLQALQVLTRFAAKLSPLLTPRLLLLDAELLLIWTDSCGCPASQRPLLVDQQMSAVVAMASWLGGRSLPWRFHFNRTRPADLSQHAVHLGTQLQFDCQIDAMRLDLQVARQPWPERPGQGVQALIALDQGADPAASRRGQLAALYEWLLPQAATPPTLAQAAEAFGVSPATFKRHLAQQGTHFQAELDAVRSQVALYLLHQQGQSSEAVAQALGFYDSTNFRRSFKRWTGLNPAHLGWA